MSRQLAAIMFTDIEGYTALMQRDEQSAIDIRQRHRSIFNSITERNHGKVLQYYGDGTLSMFNSIVDAVNCGLQLQLAFRRAPEVPVRIGIHSGDITLIGDEIVGDGVNIASRIEALAVPGSVFISKRVYDEIKNHTEFKVTAYGSIPLKNVQKRVGIFALANEGLIVPDRGLIRKRAFKKMGMGVVGKRALLAAMVLFIITILYGILLWHRQGQATGDTTSPKSIAVLPFVNLSNDPDQEYFSDGMTADLLSQLAKIKDLRVVSRTSVMQYKNTSKPIRTIANELDATHILEGSVRKYQDQVRIGVNLIEASTDNRIWSVDFDRSIEDVLQVQREVSLEVVKLMQADLTQEERARVEKTITTSQQAYDLYQRGQSLIRRTEGTANQLNEAIRLFQQAIELDPNFSLAYVGLADAYLFYATWGRTPPNDAIPQARVAALKAQELDDEIGECYQTLGAISLYEHDHQTANQYFQQAVAMSPGFVETYSWLGQLHLLQGNLENAVTFFRKALELDPLSSTYNGYIITAYYVNGQFDRAIEAAEEVLVDQPTNNYVLWNLANVYVGKEEYGKAIEIFNRRSLGTYTNWALGYAYGRAGMMEEAKKILDYHLKRIETDYVPAVMISAIYLGLDEQDMALEWLERAFEEGIAPILLPDVIMGPMFAPLRSNPGFSRLLGEVNLQQS